MSLGNRRAVTAAAWLGLALAHSAAPPALALDARRADDSTVRVISAIVRVTGDKIEPMFCCGTGSGFVVDDEHVVTNHHVVDLQEQSRKTPGGRVLYIVRTAGSTKNVQAQLIWSSAELDLAVLKVPKLGKPAVTLAEAAMLEYPIKGQKVFAIGYPAISDQALDTEEAKSHSTVTQGIVGKTVRATVGGKVRPVVQHDASINPGNSGGPLFDNCGVVVGVNTFVAISRLQVMKDDQGRDIATGAAASGIFLSPHVGNLIQASKAVPELRKLNLRTTSSTCSDDEAGVPPWLYAVLVLFLLLTGTAIALALTRRREVVRVVESYSAWVRRKGVAPGAPRSGIPPRAGGPERGAPERTAMPAARGRLDGPPGAPVAIMTGDWTLSGFDSQGNTLRLAISPADFDKAMSGTDKGVIIGRSSSLADKVLGDSSVSRRHCKLARLPDGSLTVEDLNSAYGTKVNGHALTGFQPVPVGAGDKLGLGAVTLDLTQEP